VALHAVASRVAFPDQRVTLDDGFAAGAKVAVRFTVRGTHLGSLLDVAPTGKPVAVQGVAIYRVAGGKIAEGWVGFDLLGLLGQLGLLERFRVPAGSEGPPVGVPPRK
jgi:predicted ester cyclase